MNLTVRGSRYIISGMKNRFAAILALVLFLSAFAFSLHQHGDGLAHDDCPTCIAYSHHHCTTPKTVVEISVNPTGYYLSLYQSPFFFSDFNANLAGRSPPLS